MRQVSRKNTLSSRLRSDANKRCFCHEAEVIAFASKRCFRKMNHLKYPESSLFAPRNAVVKGKEEKRTTLTRISGIYTPLHQANAVHEPSTKVMTSGVYFNNQEIFRVIHPTQVKYDVRHVTKVPNLPLGTPLAKPSRLGVIDRKLLPCISTTMADTSKSSQKKNESQLEKKMSHARKRPKRAREILEDATPYFRPSKCISVVGTEAKSIRASRNKLSSEEQIFVEAAIALSSVGVPVVKTQEKEQKNQTSLVHPPRHAISPSTYPSPSQRLFTGDVSSQTLLPLQLNS